MKVRRTIVLTMLLYASVVSRPRGRSAAKLNTTAALATAHQSSSSALAGPSAASSTSETTSLPNSISAGKSGKKTGTVTHVDSPIDTMNAFLAELVEYVEKISTTIQSGFGGSRAAPKLNTKDGYESPWNYGNWDSGDDSTKQVGKKGTTGTRVGSPPKNIFNEALSSLVTRISQAVSLSNAYGGAGR